MPTGIASVGEGAFNIRNNLALTNLLDGLTRANNRADYSCANLTSIEYKGTVYASKQVPETALNDAGVIVCGNVFVDTGLQ